MTQQQQQQSQANELDYQPNKCASINQTTYPSQIYPYYNNVLAMQSQKQQPQYLPVQSSDQAASPVSSPSPPAGFGNTPSLQGEPAKAHTASPVFSFSPSPLTLMGTIAYPTVNTSPTGMAPTVAPNHPQQQDREKNRNYLFFRRKRPSLTENLDLVVRQRRSGAVIASSER